jgi:hypothetical protein
MKANALSGSVIVAIGITSGCTASNSPSVGVDRPVRHYEAVAKRPVMRTIHIDSEPAGARIEVNEDYVCDAPCDVQVRADSEGRFWEKTKIRGLPKGYGYTQSKLFFGYGQSDNPYLHSDHVPQKIFFDMNLAPVPRPIDVNVNQ